MQIKGWIKPLLIPAATALLCLFATFRVSADQDYIGLRNGPSEAFPVVFEVTGDRELIPVMRRGSWLLVTDNRNQGWLHVDELYRVKSMPRDEMWKLVNDARPGALRIEFGLTSESAYSLGVQGALFGQDLYLRRTKAAEGYSSWSLLEAGLVNEFSRPADNIVFNWSAAVGVGNEEPGNRQWNEETDEQVIVGSGALEAIWMLERYFEIGARGSLAVTLDDAMIVRPAVSLIWRVRL